MARRKKRDTPRRKIPAPSPRYLDYRHILKKDRSHVDSVSISKPVDFRPLEDLRYARPDHTDQIFKTVHGTVARIAHRIQSKVHGPGLSGAVRTYFQDPRRALVCIRRHDRRRVLFALRKIGKGRKVSPVHRWTEKSLVRCK